MDLRRTSGLETTRTRTTRLGALLVVAGVAVAATIVAGGALPDCPAADQAGHTRPPVPALAPMPVPLPAPAPVARPTPEEVVAPSAHNAGTPATPPVEAPIALQPISPAGAAAVTADLLEAEPLLLEILDQR